MTDRSASRRTSALAACLAVVAAVLVARAPTAPLLAQHLLGTQSTLVAGLALAFVVADLCLLHVELRREAYSATLAGAPLVLGLLLCDGRELVAARLVGAAVAFALQRTAPRKAGYNLAAYAFEAALDLWLLHLLVEPGTELDVHVAGACGLVVLVVDQLMSALVALVIRWHQGPLTRLQRAEVHLPALVCSALATTTSFGLLLLSDDGPVGSVVVVVALAAAAVVYRAFQVLHRRHQALARVHGFVALGDDEDCTAEELAGTLLAQVRELMRASRSELLLPHPEHPVHLTVGEDGVPRRGHPAVDPPTDGPRLLHRGVRHEGGQDWLRRRGAKDAVVAPLPARSGAGLGTLLVLDRLGGTGSFSQEDQTLLQTLAGHLAVAVDSGRRRDLLRYEATHDGLTGLANRSLLHATISRSLEERDADGGVVLLLDLDGFKEVNDTLGHHVGDQLLVEVARRLVDALPGSATVARLGGDEFAAFVPPGADRQTPSGATLAQRVAEALVRPVELPDATLRVGASTGVAPVQPGSGASDLLRHADTAMYAAKASREPVVVYRDELDRGRAERRALLADLHLALERDELFVRYQPKLDLATRRIRSVEALVRWQHPVLGLVGPDVFIPLAESNGLIADLTAVVLGRALEQCAAWREDGLDVAVAVNLSARTVNDPTLPEQIGAALLAADVPATSLVLEITESAVMDDPARAVAVLERIAALGVRLSLDDFGTGWSSLSYLQRLPVSEVKIDRSFISGLTGDSARSQVLVRSIISLGRSLDLRVVAEGVEDGDTLELLRDLGCDLVQGYHVSRPVPAADLATLLHRRHGRTRSYAVPAQR